MAEIKNRKPGRPRKAPSADQVVDEQSATHLQMAGSPQKAAEAITLEEVGKKWYDAYFNISDLRNQLLAGHKLTRSTDFLSETTEKWNELNPFLQNQRLKMLNQLPSSSRRTASSTCSNPRRITNRSFKAPVGIFRQVSRFILTS
jgi:hypothetical protein